MIEDHFYPSYIELDKAAFEQNLSFLQEYLADDVLFSSVIKGNAYGHGIDHFVPMAEECGLRHFSVFSSDEAREARRASTHEDTHIMIMGMINNGVIAWAIEHDVSFFIFELDRMKAAVAESQRLGKPARIHLHLETGMHRLGLEPKQFEEAKQLLKGHPKQLQLDGICTHYAGAESVGNYVRVHEQIKNFKEYQRWFAAR